jgi:hypothetical protein
MPSRLRFVVGDWLGPTASSGVMVRRNIGSCVVQAVAVGW